MTSSLFSRLTDLFEKRGAVEILARLADGSERFNESDKHLS
jgi:DNA-binding HxlR family transcriptional regulator